MDLSKNANRFSGKQQVADYDHFRPTPPGDLVNLACNYIGSQAEHLLDVGCGSGLSTTVWVDRIKNITCVDPSGDMLEHAKEKLDEFNNIRFLKAFGHDIPCQDHSFDIITCSQSFHWMDPIPTLKEFNRLLRPGGVLLIYDCIWPPSVNLIWELAFIELFDGILSMTKKQGEPLMHFWSKNHHKKNVVDCQYFTSVKQVGFHKVVEADSAYFIGLAESQGGLQAMRKIGIADDDNGWTNFIRTIKNNPIPEPISYTLHYNALFAIKIL